MAENLAEELNPEEREKLYKKLTASDTTQQKKLADSTKTDRKSLDNSASHNTESSQEINENQLKHEHTFANFYKQPITQRLWYYFLSLFTLKSAEMLFRDSQLDKLRQNIVQQNNQLLVFDSYDKIHLISTYLPERFNSIFRLSLEILPIINQIDQNPQFMKEIITKLVFIDYTKNSQNIIPLEAENFISEEEFQNFVFRGDVVIKNKIDLLMQEVYKKEKILPISLYKYAASILKPLYQFQRICYLPFSNFFQPFRNSESQNKDDMYSNILPQDAYDSINILYEVSQEIGEIHFNKKQFLEIIDSYSLDSGAARNKAANSEFLECFSHLQTLWNNLIQKTPVESLLMFTAENPYLGFSPIPSIDTEILEKIPRQIKKAYQQSVSENIEKMAYRLRENSNKYLVKKYLSQPPLVESQYYSNQRADLMPHLNLNYSENLFAHCESFSYIHHFLHYFCTNNILKPLKQLYNGEIFNSDNHIYSHILKFIENMEVHKNELNFIEQNLQPDNRTDVEIKEILNRIEQRSEEAEVAYKNMLLHIDRDIRYLIEQILQELHIFAERNIPIMKQAILERSCQQKFSSAISQFTYMYDFQNPEYTPLTPAKILELWEQYIDESALLIYDQLEKERQNILGDISKVATNLSSVKYTFQKNIR